MKVRSGPYTQAPWRRSLNGERSEQLQAKYTAILRSRLAELVGGENQDARSKAVTDEVTAQYHNEWRSICTCEH